MEKDGGTGSPMKKCWIEGEGGGGHVHGINREEDDQELGWCQTWYR